MKILFSPSENKNFLYNQAPLSPGIENNYKKYLNFLQNAGTQELQKIWGYKKIEDVEKMRLISSQSCVIPAIECYCGVAYEALDFASLEAREKEFILDSVLIFSNLFGVVSAGENLPFYKLKQGEGFGDFKTKDLYASLQDKIDLLLQEECIIDLRAEFYQKLYAIKSHYFSFEFLKNGKRVSHYAKYYRGIVLREIAKNHGLYKIEERLENLGLKLLECKETLSQTKFVFGL